MKIPLPDQYLTPEDLVILFRLPSVETVYQWRRKGVGPRSFRVGRYVRFDPEVVRVWVESQMEEAA
ncbi:helix-turn-helix transcriptional regulator [Streptomyces violaceusniger]|uniref:Helix-turn-helix domain-containing protein n=1 Tax=Streptomyces violaceusniger (strain Tu 4113) TaxID=653045 RepID=G2PCA4_STRV4|nr:helix-turn-helix domain-containing protein [Streptomyces violaceusniger]AEM81704.1 hypothetical protein Strvi_1970 [Streptomyces violaceusniger Tu 4113]